MKPFIALLILSGCASDHGVTLPACPVPHHFTDAELLAQANQEQALKITTDSPIGQELLDYWRLRTELGG